MSWDRKTMHFYVLFGFTIQQILPLLPPAPQGQGECPHPVAMGLGLGQALANGMFVAILEQKHETPAVGLAHLCFCHHQRDNILRLPCQSKEDGRHMEQTRTQPTP